ncbi:condensation domain-containing protein [Actinoplanes sp. NPDC051859]|uniref:condensation domain-containing protein n=1 Tax=Actinoplanes sp. NPDC051859 TaxID=3363909 RepID=UPI0037B59405
MHDTWHDVPHRMSIGLRRQERADGFVASESIICNVYHFPGTTVDTDRLDAAVRRVVAANPALHSAYRIGADGAVEHRLLPIPVPLVESSPPDGTTWDDVCAEARTIAAAESAVVLDVRTGRPLRIVHVGAEAVGFALVIRIDHSVCDGLSLAQFLREIGEAFTDDAGYASAHRDRASLAAVAAAERRVLDGEPGQQVREAWRGRLPRGVPEVVLERPLPWYEAPPEGDYQTYTLQGAEYERHRDEARRLRVTSFVLATAKVLVALRPHVLGDDLAFFSPLPGRFVPEAADVVGNFINLLPVTVEAPREADVATTVAAVRDGMLWTLRHQGMPFDAIMDEVRHVDATGEKLPRNRRSIFVAGFPPDDLILDEVRAQTALPRLTTALFDLSLWISDDGERLRGMAVSRRALVSAERVASWLDALRRPVASSGGPS